MSTFSPLEYDERYKNMHIVNTNDIAYIAAKRNFDPTKELKYIEKSKKSVCKCHHPHFIGGRCYYHTCRHFVEVHYKGAASVAMFRLLPMGSFTACTINKIVVMTSSL